MAYFEPTDEGLVPDPKARAPWSPDMLHGRLLAGLAAWAIERDHPAEGFVPARLTVDLYKAPAMAATTVESRLVRAGGRVRAVDAFVTVGGQDVARASTLWLRRAEHPDGDGLIPGAPHWDGPQPSELETRDQFAEGWDIRPVGGQVFGAPGPGPRRVWLCDNDELVRGIPLTPFVRVALCADFASPLANSGPNGLDYINADLTLHLGRLPAGEWIGIETDDRVAVDGVSVAQCRYFDEDGPLGFSTVSAVVTGRMSPPSDEGQ